MFLSSISQPTCVWLVFKILKKHLSQRLDERSTLRRTNF